MGLRKTYGLVKNMDLQAYQAINNPTASLTQYAAPVIGQHINSINLFRRIRPKWLATGTALSFAALSIALYASDFFKAAPKIPCNPTITPYRVILSGDCNRTQIEEAFAKGKVMLDERQIELKAEGRRMADESNKKWQTEIDKTEAEIVESEAKTARLIADRDQTIVDNERSKIDIDKLIAERDQWILDQPERLRKLFPTPEEVAFKKAVQKIEIDCEMDEKFFGWPGYEPRGCELDGLNLLGAAEVKTCDELKPNYRKASLKYHPDKNNSTEAVQKFIDITNAFEKLCFKG